MSLADQPPPVSSSHPRRSTRDRPAKAPLSYDAVVDAALEILREEGLEAVTMRRVARALDTGAASLYVYVANREALMVAMFDRVIATIELEPPDPSRWREQLYTLLQRMRQALVDHPGMVAMTLVDPPTTGSVLHLMENMLGILLAGEIDPQDAVWACDVLGMLATGAAREDAERTHRFSGQGDYADWAEGLYETFAGLPVDTFPLMTRHAQQMVTGDSNDRFRFGVDVVVDGVVARAARG